MRTPGHTPVVLSTSSVTPDIMLPAFPPSLGQSYKQMSGTPLNNYVHVFCSLICVDFHFLIRRQKQLKKKF